MGTILNVIQEEYERLQNADAAYRKIIESLPAGAPTIRTQNSKKYLYLKRREGDKVVQKYVAPVGTAKAEEVLEQVKKRNRYRELLKQIKSDMLEAKKALHGRV